MWNTCTRPIRCQQMPQTPAAPHSQVREEGQPGREIRGSVRNMEVEDIALIMKKMDSRARRGSFEDSR